MSDFTLGFTVQGAIFDVDETLLDTFPDGPLSGLHEGARLLAIHEVGKRLNNPRLQALTIEDCHVAFDTAKTSTLPAATWNMLIMGGVVSGDIQNDHPLLNELVELKHKYYEKTLKTHGKPILNAERFVRGLAHAGFGDHLAIASSGRLDDILVFLEMAGIEDLIPPARIQSFETVQNFKPHPEPFDKAFKTLGLPESARAHTLVFEDDPRGIKSAKAAGLYVCAITSHKFSREQLENIETPPDLIADSFAEFSRLLNIPLV